MRDYYELHEYISNSDLGNLDSMLYNRREAPANLQDIFDFGNLVDAAITERHRVNYDTGVLLGEQRRDIQFTEQQMLQARLMQQAYDADDSIAAMCAGMRWQHVILRRQFPIEHDGVKLLIPARCKFDGLDKPRRLGVDVKSTAAETYSQFIAAFNFFNYDRQGAWYMDLAGIDRMLYIGIGKKVRKGQKLPPVFKHVIQRGDECYQSGLAKYTPLAFKYHFLIHQLNQYSYNHVSINKELSL